MNEDDYMKDRQAWINNIKDYEKIKKILPWGYNPKPITFTSKVMKENENYFNPILQQYNDKSTENKIRNDNERNLINNLAKSHVN